MTVAFQPSVLLSFTGMPGLAADPMAATIPCPEDHFIPMQDAASISATSPGSSDGLTRLFARDPEVTGSQSQADLESICTHAHLTNVQAEQLALCFSRIQAAEILHWDHGVPRFEAVHPDKRILSWSDAAAGLAVLEETMGDRFKTCADMISAWPGEYQLSFLSILLQFPPDYLAGYVAGTAIRFIGQAARIACHMEIT